MHEDVAEVTCPYCFETHEVWLDPETEGALVQDCEVCCNPWQLYIWRDEQGHARIDVSRAQ